MWERVGDRTELQHIDPQSSGHYRVSFPFLWAAQLGAPSAMCWLSLPHLVTNRSRLQTLNRESRGPFCRVLAFSTASSLQLVWSPNWLTSCLHRVIVQRLLLLVGVTIALIQPIHGQSFNSDIPRPDAPVIYIGAFPIWQPGRVVGQYTARVFNDYYVGIFQWIHKSNVSIFYNGLLEKYCLRNAVFFRLYISVQITY